MSLLFSLSCLLLSLGICGQSVARAQEGSEEAARAPAPGEASSPDSSPTLRALRERLERLRAIQTEASAAALEHATTALEAVGSLSAQGRADAAARARAIADAALTLADRLVAHDRTVEALRVARERLARARGRQQAAASALRATQAAQNSESDEVAAEPNSEASQ